MMFTKEQMIAAYRAGFVLGSEGDVCDPDGYVDAVLKYAPVPAIASPVEDRTVALAKVLGSLLVRACTIMEDGSQPFLTPMFLETSIEELQQAFPELMPRESLHQEKA